MNAPVMTQLAALKQGARATWAAGDYPAIARMQLWEMGPRVVAAAGIRPACASRRSSAAAVAGSHAGRCARGSRSAW